MFIPGPGYEFYPFRIQGQKDASGSASKNLIILTQKIFWALKISGMFIPYPGSGSQFGSSKVESVFYYSTYRGYINKIFLKILD